MKSKQLLTAVYYAAKANGIAPFKLDTKTKYPRAKLTTSSTLSSILGAILFTVLYLYPLKKYLLFHIQNGVETMHFVLRLNTYSGLFRNIIIFICVIVNRKDLVLSINTLEIIMEKLKCIVQFDSFLDRKCRRMVFTQIVMTMFLYALAIITLYINSLYFEFWFTNFMLRNTLAIYFTNVFETIVLSMHFTAFLIVVQFYRHINVKLRISVDRIRTISRMDSCCGMRMQMFCDASDEIDELAALHKCVAKCTQTICKVFSMTILASLINSFIFTISGVIFI